jgi:hypothetical protein
MAQRFALLLGIAFLILGVLGFTVTGVTWPPDIQATTMLFGVLPTSVVDNAFHVFVGLCGLLTFRSLAGSAAYGGIFGVVFLALAAAGYVYPDTFGYLPNGGYDVWFHLGAGILFLMLAIAATTRRNALQHGYAVGAAHAVASTDDVVTVRDEPLRLAPRPPRDDLLP